MYFRTETGSEDQGSNPVFPIRLLELSKDRCRTNQKFLVVDGFSNFTYDYVALRLLPLLITCQEEKTREVFFPKSGCNILGSRPFPEAANTNRHRDRVWAGILTGCCPVHVRCVRKVANLSMLISLPFISNTISKYCYIFRLRSGGILHRAQIGERAKLDAPASNGGEEFV
jgi:hypothetical protein